MYSYTKGDLEMQDFKKQTVLLAANVSLDPEQSFKPWETQLLPPTGILDLNQLAKFQGCSVCDKPDNRKFMDGIIIKDVAFNELFSLQTRSSKAFPQPHESLFWGFDTKRFYSIYGKRFSVDNPLHHLQNCLDETSFNIAVRSTTASQDERHAQARAHVWQSIFKNFTSEIPYEIYGCTRYCFNGQRIQVFIFTLQRHIFTDLKRRVLINNAETTFKFSVAIKNKHSIL